MKEFNIKNESLKVFFENIKNGYESKSLLKVKKEVITILSVLFIKCNDKRNKDIEKLLTLLKNGEYDKAKALYFELLDTIDTNFKLYKAH